MKYNIIYECSDSKLCGVKNISIEPKSLSVEYNTVKHSGLLSLLVIFGVPIVLLIGGFSVWYRRRKCVIKNKI